MTSPGFRLISDPHCPHMYGTPAVTVAGIGWPYALIPSGLAPAAGGLAEAAAEGCPLQCLKLWLQADLLKRL
jgi:hypothetical protein